ncbi:hypothetical protein AQUCO_09500037v1 [Aquilegia coerulea]|uniref:PGG domain-containing protein n=1 Tax=Aquilegia coerulea TaxID=218851 RepID=A0A2G5C4R3_AQUCA|nr:hypothetical protein AQUCO_09500037v1 [Aquilegia coerulea]
MHSAAWVGVPETVKFYIGADTTKKLLTKVDRYGETPLHKAVANHQFQAVKLLIEADPSFQYGANNTGVTPLLLAIREAKLLNNMRDSGKIRTYLLEMQPSQSKVRTPDNGWTALHHAANDGDLSAIEDIFKFCPECSELIDHEGKNFLHVAVLHPYVQVVVHILGTIDLATSILNGKDRNGNTPLHSAALSENQGMTLCLLYDRRVDKMTVKTKGHRVVDAINFDYDRKKAGVRNRVDQKDLKEQSDFDLVVCALIATVSFTAGITVPGGYNSEGPNKGLAVLSKKMSFEAFCISNTLALLFSLVAMFSHFSTRCLFNKNDIKFQVTLATFCTLAAIFAMMLAFIRFVHGNINFK